MAKPDPRAALAELHQLLAHAFLPPMEPVFARAFVESLPADLGEIERELPFRCAGTVAALAGSVKGLGHRPLLAAYSALFLQPPQRASLDASVHLDGAAMGPTTLGVEERYARHGLRPCDALRELPDHLSRLFEFSGFLLGRAASAATPQAARDFEEEARDFIATFLQPWLPALAVEVRQACEELSLPRPYQHLAELAAAAAWEGEAWRAAAAPAPGGRTPRQAHCTRCARPYAADAALRAVRRIMQRKGLPVGHLDRCEGCRGLTDEVQGMLEPAGMRAF